MIVTKKVDLYGQLILIIAWPIAAIVPDTRELAFFGYFIVGGWQLLSTAFHLYHREKFLLIDSRKTYQKALRLIFIGLISLPIPIVNGIYACLMLLIGPVMALYYLLITAREYEIWQAKAFVHLK